jgi:hypothetical protein
MRWWVAFAAGCLMGVWGLAYRVLHRAALRREQEIAAWRTHAWEHREQAEWIRAQQARHRG